MVLKFLLAHPHKLLCCLTSNYSTKKSLLHHLHPIVWTPNITIKPLPSSKSWLLKPSEYYSYEVGFYFWIFPYFICLLSFPSFTDLNNLLPPATKQQWSRAWQPYLECLDSIVLFQKCFHTSDIFRFSPWWLGKTVL